MDTKRILTVNNNKDELKTIATLLRSEGYTMLTAFDGISALSLARKEMPSLVIIDIDAPAGGGLRLLDRLNSFLPAQTKAVVMANGKSLQGVEEAMEEGKVFLVHKPLVPEELLSCLRKAFSDAEHSPSEPSLLEDEVTGLFTLKAFALLAEQQIRVADRAKRQMVMLRIRLKHARQLNLYHGSGSRDRVLIELAKLISGTFRGSDIKARIEEDEFAVLALETAEGADTLMVDRLRNGMARLSERQSLPFMVWTTVDTKTYDPGKPCSLLELLTGVERSFTLCTQPPPRSDSPLLWGKAPDVCLSASAR